MARILLIDDELPLRRVLRSILERAGHTVLDAPDGRTGMELWYREPTDVVVTDIFMPEKDGVEVIREMKNCEAKPKIIAMSGAGQRGLFDWKSAVHLLGADRVLVKPFDQQMFLLAIQEVLCGMPDTNDAGLPSRTVDQRKYPRLPVFLPVSFGDGVIAQTGTVVDISREGCRIRCADAAPEAKYFRIEISLDDSNEMLTVDLAVMRWSRNGELGVEFIRMESHHQARLRKLILNCEAARSQQGHLKEVQQCLRASSPGEETEGQP